MPLIPSFLFLTALTALTALTSPHCSHSPLLTALTDHSPQASPHTAPLVRQPAYGGTRASHAAALLMQPLQPLPNLPRWQLSPATRSSGVSASVMAAVPRTAPLHVRVASLIQLVRTNCANDGCSMPTLPPFEASLLLAAESCKDVLVAREWRACELELAKEGVVPMAADRSRIAATVHSGGSRIDGVWSAQHEMLTEELSRDMNVRPCGHVGMWACGHVGDAH